MSLAFFGVYTQVPVLAPLLGLATISCVVCIAWAWKTSCRAPIGPTTVAAFILSCSFSALTYQQIRLGQLAIVVVQLGRLCAACQICGSIFFTHCILESVLQFRLKVHTEGRFWFTCFSAICLVLLGAEFAAIFTKGVTSGLTLALDVALAVQMFVGSVATQYFARLEREERKTTATALLALVAAPLFTTFTAARFIFLLIAMLGFHWRITDGDVPPEIVLLSNVDACMYGIFGTALVLSLVTIVHYEHAEELERRRLEEGVAMQAK